MPDNPGRSQPSNPIQRLAPSALINPGTGAGTDYLVVNTTLAGTVEGINLTEGCGPSSLANPSPAQTVSSWVKVVAGAVANYTVVNVSGQVPTTYEGLYSFFGAHPGCTGPPTPGVLYNGYNGSGGFATNTANFYTVQNQVDYVPVTQTTTPGTWLLSGTGQYVTAPTSINSGNQSFKLATMPYPRPDCSAVGLNYDNCVTLPGEMQTVFDELQSIMMAQGSLGYPLNNFSVTPSGIPCSSI